MRQKIAEKTLKQLKDDYNSISAEFSKTRHYSWPEFQHFSKYINKGDKVLDLGCGNGRLVEFLDKFQVNYLGIDNADKLITEAIKKFPDYEFKKGDMLNISENESSFDKVFCIAALHHLPNEKLRIMALQEIRKVLKDDGLLVLTVWNLFQPKYKSHLSKAFWRSIFTIGNYSTRDVFIPWGQDKKIKRYYYAFKLKELKKLLLKAGFEMVEEIKENFNFCLVVRKAKVKILGVEIDRLTKSEALNRIKNYLNSAGQFYGVTPNPEIILAAQKDPEYKDILNKADLKVADGVGLILVAGGVLPERVSGTDLMIEICKVIPAKVYLLGAEEGVAEGAKKKMEASGFKAKIVGTYAGLPNEKGIIEKINEAKPEILFVAFGAPNQEKWIYQNLKKMPTIKFAMGVGGAFDFISGTVKRAPLIVRKLGLEWLFRLIIQPFRIKRIYNAVIKFPLEVIKDFTNK